VGAEEQEDIRLSRLSQATLVYRSGIAEALLLDVFLAVDDDSAWDRLRSISKPDGLICLPILLLPRGVDLKR